MKETEMEQLERELFPFDPNKKECQCSMRIKLVGDGCRYCNPELREELLTEEEL